MPVTAMLPVLYVFEYWQAARPNRLMENKRKKVHITPAQQMLNRFEALRKTASSSIAAAVKQSSVVDSVAMKQHADHAEGKVNNSAAVYDTSKTKVPCASKPNVGPRVAHKPTQVRVISGLCLH